MFGYVPPVDRARKPGALRAPMLWSHDGSFTPAAWDFIPRRRPSVMAPFELLQGGREGSSHPALAVQGSIRRAGRGLIIDLDDTLYPRERFVRSGLAAVAQHVSAAHNIAADQAYSVMTRALSAGGAGAELQALCNRFGLSPDVIPALVQVIRTHTPSLFLNHDVVATLERLRRDGWALVILTNGLPSVQFRKIAALGVTPLVDEIIYAEEHAVGGKPAVAPFHAALRSLDLAPSQCVCVGDDVERDIRGARSLGIATIRMARPGVAVAAHDEADAVIDSVQQLPEAAARLLNMVTADVA